MADDADVFETSITWRKPAHRNIPAFNTPLLLALGGWRDSGRGFKAHIHIVQARIMIRDADGDAAEGECMYLELQSGDIEWPDLQFQLLDDEDEPLDYYSDSIMWWAEMPVLPDDRKKSDSGAETPFQQ